MSRPRTTAGKRNVQQQKREKAEAKQQRRAARRAGDSDVDAVPVRASEAELMAELAEIQRAVEGGTVSPEEFEHRREQVREQLVQIERLKG